MKYILTALLASALGLSTISTYAEIKKTGSERSFIVVKDSKGKTYRLDPENCSSKRTNYCICGWNCGPKK